MQFISLFSSSNIVWQVLPYLHSKSFDTRTAASTALSQICSLLPVWFPSSASDSAPYPATVDLSTPAPFPPFSVPSLLNTPASSLLLGSSGKEYAKPASFRSPAEVAKARKEAMNRLGLDFLGMGDEDADMDWDKELADGAEAETVTSEVKSEAAETEMQDAEGVKTVRPQLARLQTDSLLQPPDVKMESPAISPVGKTMSEDSPVPRTSVSPHDAFTPNTTGMQSLAFAANSMPPPAAPDSSTELSVRERNRLKRKRKAGMAFVAGTTTNGHTQNQAGPSGPPPPLRTSKYGTVAAGEGGNK